MLPKGPTRYRSTKHRRWVATIPCIACYRGLPLFDRLMPGYAISQVHHLTHVQPKARGLKASDELCVPMCIHHHDPNSRFSVHAAGGEAAWWEIKGIDPRPIARKLWRASIKAGRVKIKEPT